MTTRCDPFSNRDFIERFSKRRLEADNVNAWIDEPAILKLTTRFRDCRALEVGCATGMLSRKLAETFREVVSIDASLEMIEAANSRPSSKNLLFQHSSIEDFSCSELFDVVVSSMAMHLIQDFRLVSSRVFNVLKPGGTFIFSQRHPVRTCDPNGHAPNSTGDAWIVKDYFDTSAREFQWLESDVSNFHRPISEIVSGLIDAGFTIRGIEEPRFQCDGSSSDSIREHDSIPAVLLIECSKNI